MDGYNILPCLVTKGRMDFSPKEPNEFWPPCILWKNVSLLNISSFMVYFWVKHNNCQHLGSRLEIPSYLYSHFLECMGMCQTKTLRLNAWYSALSISNNIFYPNDSVKRLLRVSFVSLWTEQSFSLLPLILPSISCFIQPRNSESPYYWYC